MLPRQHIPSRQQLPHLPHTPRPLSSFHHLVKQPRRQPQRRHSLFRHPSLNSSTVARYRGNTFSLPPFSSAPQISNVAASNVTGAYCNNTSPLPSSTYSLVPHQPHHSLVPHSHSFRPPRRSRRIHYVKQFSPPPPPPQILLLSLSISSLSLSHTTSVSPSALPPCPSLFHQHFHSPILHHVAQPLPRITPGPTAHTLLPLSRSPPAGHYQLHRPSHTHPHPLSSSPLSSSDTSPPGWLAGSIPHTSPPPLRTPPPPPGASAARLLLQQPVYGLLPRILTPRRVPLFYNLLWFPPCWSNSRSPNIVSGRPATASSSLSRCPILLMTAFCSSSWLRYPA